MLIKEISQEVYSNNEEDIVVYEAGANDFREKYSFTNRMMSKTGIQKTPFKVWVNEHNEFEGKVIKMDSDV